MRPDRVVTLPRAVAARETDRSAPTDAPGLRMATGVYLGVALGIVMWLAVVGACAILAALL